MRTSPKIRFWPSQVSRSALFRSTWTRRRTRTRGASWPTVQLPPKDAIRVEEWLNYFSYDYAQPTGSAPFAVNTEVTSCPWNSAHKLVRIGIKGKEIREENVPARNLVFLLDVSGSMLTPDKLPLVKRGLAMMVSTRCDRKIRSRSWCTRAILAWCCRRHRVASAGRS